MLERYYIKPETIDRIRASWIGEPIERYVVWLTENGYAARNIFRRVPILMHFGEFARVRGAERCDDLPAYVARFAESWAKERGKKCTSKRARMGVLNEAKNPIQQMLRLVVPGYAGAGRSRRVQDPFPDCASKFYAYLREERGLRESSVRHYLHYLRGFETFLGEISLYHLGELSPPVLSAYILKSSRTLSRSSMVGLCCCLRVFLRYLHRQRLLERDLSRVVESPQKYRLSNVPRSISWDEVRRMLEAVDRRTSLGKRDYAVLLLLVTYGLRAHEVARMTLDDIDWKECRIRIPERKAGHWMTYPLSPIVGEAILEYLRHGRPQSPARHVFFRVPAPCRPLTSVAISNLASQYIKKAGIQVARPGSHTLRHTCVQRLVDANFDLKLIGDYVGHRSSSSTEIYTKVAIEALREVALGDGENVL
jgi:integrase/recombinase XerD